MKDPIIKFALDNRNNDETLINLPLGEKMKKIKNEDLEGKIKK